MWRRQKLRGSGFCRSSGEEEDVLVFFGKKDASRRDRTVEGGCGRAGLAAGEDGVKRVMRYRMDGKEERPQKTSHQKIVLLLFFLVIEVCIDSCLITN